METYTQQTMPAMPTHFTQAIQEGELAELIGGSEYTFYRKFTGYRENPIVILKEDGFQVNLNYRYSNVVTAKPYPGAPEEVVTKVAFDRVDVVYWGDHPLEEMMDDEDCDELGEEPSEEMIYEANQILMQILNDEIEEFIGEGAEILTEPEPYSRYGGQVVGVRLPYQVTVTRSFERDSAHVRAIG